MLQVNAVGSFETPDAPDSGVVKHSTTIVSETISSPQYYVVNGQSYIGETLLTVSEESEDYSADSNYVVNSNGTVDLHVRGNEFSIQRAGTRYERTAYSTNSWGGEVIHTYFEYDGVDIGSVVLEASYDYGFDAGFDEGYDEGYADGFADGWNAAVDSINN